MKVTQISRSKPKLRFRLAERVAETLLAVPAFTRNKEVVFHGDPHAGNLLYDSRSDTLIVLDWALTERLSWADRRLILLLVFRTMLRDSDGMVAVIEGLRIHRKLNDSLYSQTVKRCVKDLLESLPFLKVPGPMSAFELLERLATEGIRFPPALVVFRKATFTLGGVVEDIAGKAVNIDSVLQRFAVNHWIATGATYCSLLSTADWLGLQWSALTFGSRVFADGISRPPRWLWRVGRGGVSLLPEIAGRITPFRQPRVLPMSGAARLIQKAY